tara:strand:- start:813 stop:1328 length:516 start_codon:yes stop_codon:yes gene_type:complete
MLKRVLLGLFSVLALAGFAPAGEPAPQLKIASIAQLPRPLPLPYHEGRDASADVAAALQRARTANKPLMIELGGNWCADCRILAGVLVLPQMRGWMARNYEVVHVDVGQFDRNLDIPARFGLARLRAVPAVLIIDPATGRMRNSGRELALADARVLRPQAIADWMAQWTTN